MLISGLGYHEPWINGQRVGDHVLDPSQTDYELRVFYIRHDVTDLVREGGNALGVILGNGWYNQDRVWGRNGLSYGQPRLMTELHLRYVDGTNDVLRADDHWRWAPGPIQENNVYAGESYDGRFEIDGWCSPGFDDSSWKFAVLMEPPGGELQEQTMPPMRRVEELPPAAVSKVRPGLYVVDFGQNFAGWTRIEVKAPAGTEIALRYAETVCPDGTLDTSTTGVFATKVEQIDRYICRGEPCGQDCVEPDPPGASTNHRVSQLSRSAAAEPCGSRRDDTEAWEPRFTYHGFRYVEVTGWPGELSPEQITGIVVHNDLPVAGRFDCSDERLNQLHRMALWTHRSNMHGLPEDCPAREKCGWLGDANLVAEYSLWNYDAKVFWEKFLGDIETTRTFNDGLPGNVAPGKRCSRNTAKPDWAAAFIMVPWYLYQFSGDRDILRRHWQGMTHLMTYFRTIASATAAPVANKEQRRKIGPAGGNNSPGTRSSHAYTQLTRSLTDNWILPGGYGDYFDPGTDAIVLHTPQTLSTTLWFFRCAEVMSVMAAALNDANGAEKYRVWRENIAAALTASFYDWARGSFGSQTANAMALAFNVLPEEGPRILEALVNDIRERDNHMNVGVMGVRFILEVLTRGGKGELALALMHQNSYPSFGHLIEGGATTLWECWGEKEHNGTHGPRSLNHPFMGGYDNWFLNTLAGIQPDREHPGFRRFLLQPHPVKGLEWVRCRYECQYGPIESNWRVQNGEFVWDVLVPEGTSAAAMVPYSKKAVELGTGTHNFRRPL